MENADREQARARLEMRLSRRQSSTVDVLLDAGGLASSDSVTAKKTLRKSSCDGDSGLPAVSLSTYKIPASSTWPAVFIPTNTKLALLVLAIVVIVFFLGMKACSSL